MDAATIIHDLEAIKADFMKNNGGAYPVCLDYAIDAVKLAYDEKGAKNAELRGRD